MADNVGKVGYPTTDIALNLDSGSEVDGSAGLLLGRVRLIPDPLAVSAVVDGETVIMTPDMRFVRLDSVGGQIWELIEQGHDIDGVVRVLTDRYEVSAQTACEDVEEFVGHLREAGLVTISE